MPPLNMRYTMRHEDFIPTSYPASRGQEEGSRLSSVQASQELRLQAEEIFHPKKGQAAKKLKAMTIEKARLLLSEMQAHQIELKKQNEELRLAQVELESARARYFDLYDLAPVGYCTMSGKGLILESNLTAAELLAVSREDMVEQPLTRFIFIEDQNIYNQFRKRLFATFEPQACELRMLRNDGTVFWAHMETTVVKGLLPISEQDSSEALVSRIVLIDISKRKQAQDDTLKLEAMNRQFQKSESLGIMAGGIAHHFNNKLQAVMMNVEMAIGSLPKDIEPLRYLRAARQEADKAAEVSKMMLIYLGQSISKHEPLDLSALCRQRLSAIQGSMSENVVIEIDFRYPSPVIDGNTVQIQQVVTNLLTNAFEAIGDGQGVVRLAVKTVFPTDIRPVNCYPPDWRLQNHAYACLEIADTGCGIADEDIEKLFVPFFSSKFTGRGLGLPVVLGIVRAHGGVVMVESECDRGSVFRVLFPMSAAKVSHKPERAVRARKIQQADTVLVVDDDEIVLKITRVLLSKLGFTVLSARDGIEAVEVFRQHRADIRLVVSDVSMPRMNGWETLIALRDIDPEISVILVSGFSEEQVMEGIHLERPQAFLAKPYGLPALKEAIHSIFSEEGGQGAW